MKKYIALFEMNNDGVGVVFPDIPGLFSAGDNFQTAQKNAHEARLSTRSIKNRAFRKQPKSCLWHSHLLVYWLKSWKPSSVFPFLTEAASPFA